MRGVRRVRARAGRVGGRAGVLAAAVVLAGALVSGCQVWPGGPGGPGSEPEARPGGTAPTVPAGHGTVFLGIDECSSFGTTSFTEVPCAGERAAARVVARHDGTASQGPPCPATTDFVLHIGESRRPTGTDGGGDGAIPRGYACMRKLQPPHPGDPGGGGGPRTIAGDCVYAAGRGEVRETACDGSGGHAPEYRLTAVVEERARCPVSTDLYVRLGGSRPVGCARSV